MLFQPLRRRIAILIYPEIIQEIIETGTTARRGRRTDENLKLANQIRKLDRTYAVWGASVLNANTAPAYAGPMYEWRTPVGRVRQDVLTALTALRRDPSRTIHRNTHFTCVNYFAAIWPPNAPWPADLEWPRAIARPAKTKKEAA
jgi:hypothetical protein